jgi:L-threonylcarbamoyladenylate synthase
MAANIERPDAIRRVYEVKGRKFSEALQIAMPPAVAAQYTEIDVWQEEVLKKLLPAPISFIVPNRAIPDYVNSGMKTACLGWQNEGVMRQLYEQSGAPFIGTSANPHGQPSATRVEQVVEYFGDKVAMYLDDGPTRYGVPNTIIDLTNDPITMLRKGPYDLHEIQELIAQRVTVPRPRAAHQR